MQAIESLSKGFALLISPTASLASKNCTQIVELGEGGIKRSGSYHIVNQSA